MPPMPPMPPMPGGIGGIFPSSSTESQTMASVVISRPATEKASYNAVLHTYKSKRMRELDYKKNKYRTNIKYIYENKYPYEEDLGCFNIYTEESMSSLGSSHLVNECVSMIKPETKPSQCSWFNLYHSRSDDTHFSIFE